MLRRLISLTSHLVVLILLATPHPSSAGPLEDNFNAGAEGWQIYDYNGGIPGGGNVFYPVSWESAGGVGDSGYVWGDDSRWRIDTPEDPQSILSFILYRSWVGAGALDLRDAQLAVHLRGDELDLKGASIYFWALNNARGARYHYTAQPLAISHGAWGQPQSIVLQNDPGLWHNSWQRNPGNPASLDDVLSVCDSYGFAFVGFSEEVTGRFAMDELVLSLPDLPGGVLWEDDFQSYTNYVTNWYVGDDADPGGVWSLSESSTYPASGQVMRSPVSMVGDPANVGHPINRADGDQFLHVFGPNPTTVAYASLPAAAVTRMQIEGKVRLSLEAYNCVTPEAGGWGHYVEIMALDAAPGVWSPFCFSFRLEADGKVLYYDGTSSSTYPGPGWQELTDLSAVYEPNQWYTIDFDLDFTADQVAVTLGGVTVSGLGMAGGDLEKIQTLVLWVPGEPGLYGRAALDNFKLTTIPEPLTPGDANGDGKVDDLDASILAGNWQRSGGATWAQGDFNDDGNVDDLDASILAANWHYGVGAAVPEPSTLLLAVLGAVGLALSTVSSKFFPVPGIRGIRLLTRTERCS